jgi:Lon protease-like protein
VYRTFHKRKKKKMQRQIFRHVMKNTSLGRNPECLPFDWKISNMFPRSEKEVRQHIKDRFKNVVESSVTPFEALETSTSRSTALYPRNVPLELPAFVLPSHTLLTGESASFLLFEKRYLKMIEDSPNLFIHLPSRREMIQTSVDPVGTLVSVMKSDRDADGRVHIETLAGPRVRVLEQRDEVVDTSSSEPLLHVTFELYSDEDYENKEHIFELHEQCLEILLKTEGLWSRKSFMNGMPPLLNPERLSLWMCQLGLHHQDLQQRLTWLYSQDTAERLRFVLTELYGTKTNYN